MATIVLRAGKGSPLTNAEVDANFTNLNTELASAALSASWAGVTGKPTTLTGYGITDAQPLDADLTSIAGLAGTSGFLKKTAANTWSLDTNTYLTGITSGQVTTALGFTPYNATNPSGYITASASITGSSNRISFLDTRAINDAPQGKTGYSLSADFKNNTSVSSPPVTAISGAGGYSHILTVAGWDTNGGSGGWPSQLSIGDGIAVRQATSATVWGAWRTVLHSNNFSSYALPLSGGTLTGQVSVRDVVLGSGYALKSGTFARIWEPGQAIGSASYAGLYGLASTYNAEYSAGWKSLGGGTASAITIEEGIFAFSASNAVAAANAALTWSTIIQSSATATNIVTGALLQNGNQVLHAGNYTTYSPSLTGTGASGSWGISVTGNSATATALQTARTINGVSFNGTANITVADSTKLPLTGGTLTGKLNSTGGDSARLFESLNASASNAVQFYIEHNLAATNIGNARGALNIVSPSLTGTPTAPTAAANTNTTQIATTAFVSTAVGNVPVFAAGTLLMFAQAAAPTGWTQVTTDSATNRMLRVVNTAGAGVGGSHSPILNNVVPSHTHGFSTGGASANHIHSGTTGTESAFHQHQFTAVTYSYYDDVIDTWSDKASTDASQRTTTTTSQNALHYHGFDTSGVSADHSHSGATDNGSSQTNWTPRYIDMILCSKN